MPRPRPAPRPPVAGLVLALLPAALAATSLLAPLAPLAAQEGEVVNLVYLQRIEVAPERGAAFEASAAHSAEAARQARVAESWQYWKNADGHYLGVFGFGPSMAFWDDPGAIYQRILASPGKAHLEQAMARQNEADPVSHPSDIMELTSDYDWTPEGWQGTPRIWIYSSWVRASAAEEYTRRAGEFTKLLRDIELPVRVRGYRARLGDSSRWDWVWSVPEGVDPAAEEDWAGRLIREHGGGDRYDALAEGLGSMMQKERAETWELVPAMGYVPDPSTARTAADEVKAEIERHYAAIKAGDMETAGAQHAERFTLMMAGGERFIAHSAADQEGMAGNVTAIDWTPRDIEVEVDGRNALATFYLDGTIGYADGRNLHGTWRVSETWRRHADGWKEVHHHDDHLAFTDGRSAEQLWRRTAFQWQSLAQAMIAMGLQSGVAPRDHGRALGAVFAPGWGDALTARGFVDSMIRNWALLDLRAHVIEERGERIVVQVDGGWPGDGYGASADGFRAFMEGILQGIGEPYGIQVERQRGDPVRFAFRGRR